MQPAEVIKRIPPAGAVIETTVVPHHEIIVVPFVPIVETLILHERKQLVEQRLRFGIQHAFDTNGKTRRDKECLAAGIGVRANQRMR
jgi:hypothetical protein